MTDEELQHRIEQGSSGDSEDARAYHRVFSVLNREPEFALPPTFANRVINRWEATRSKTSRDMFWLYAGIAGCIIAMVVVILMTNFKFSLGAFRFFSGYPGLVTFGVLFVLSLQWLDRKIVRKAA